MSYVGTDIHNADSNLFFYNGSYMDVHYFDASYPSDDIVDVESGDTIDDVDSDMNSEELVQDQSEVNLISPKLGQDLTPFEQDAA